MASKTAYSVLTAKNNFPYCDNSRTAHHKQKQQNLFRQCLNEGFAVSIKKNKIEPKGIFLGEKIFVFPPISIQFCERILEQRGNKNMKLKNDFFD